MSSGKVNCTCGWSWNKSDSSKKDMYICHECGRDNSNNMKNGGWLDTYEDGGTMQEHQENYNNSQASAPEGMIGDGFSNVGRNYSPAWGGQFQEGGEIPMAQNGKKKPLYVESKNDPRYRAYRDSLNSYNTSVQDKNETLDFIKRQLIKDNNNRGILDKTFNDKLTAVKKDLDYSVQTYPGGIKPLKSYIYERSDGKTQLGAYDVLKKPQQQVIIKPTTTKQTTIKSKTKPKTKPIVIPDKTTPVVEREEFTSLQPMSRGLMDTDQQIDNVDINIPVQARVPQYYNIKDTNNQNFGGGDTSYRVDSLNELRELPKELWDRKITPQYQMGGNVYPVNYVPQAQNGWLENAENSVNKWLGNPMRTGVISGNVFGEKWFNPKTKKWEIEGRDNVRHSFSGRYTSEAIQNKFPSWMQYTGIPQAAGIVGATGLGAGHELSTLIGTKNDRRSLYDKIRESGEDAFNNMIGAGVGSLPVSSEIKTNTLGKLSDDNLLPDGVSGRANSVYVKHQTGGSIPGAIGLVALGSMKKQKEGGIIKDDRGQWDHPGEVTEINSNEITMKPDPMTGKKLTMPLLGISDTGDVKIMKPGKDYKFKGTKVTEYPVAQNGFLDKLKSETKSRKDKVNIKETPKTVVNDNISNASKMATKGDEAIVKDVKYSNKIAQAKAQAQAEAQKKFNALPKEEQERILYDQYNQEQGTITEYNPDSTLNKIGQSMFAPFTAMTDLYQNGEVRDNLLKSIINNPGSANAYDAAYLGTLGYAAAPSAIATASSIGAAAAPYATMIGNSLAADAVIGGNTIAGLNLGNAIGAGFATHGAMNIGPDISKWADRPSWENAESVGWDTLDMLPAVGPVSKTIGEGISATEKFAGKGFNYIGENAPKVKNFVKDVAGDFSTTMNDVRDIQGMKDYVRTNADVDLNRISDYALTNNVPAIQSWSDFEQAYRNLSSELHGAYENASYFENPSASADAVKKWGSKAVDKIGRARFNRDPNMTPEELQKLYTELVAELPKSKDVESWALPKLRQSQLKKVFNKNEDFKVLKNFAKNIGAKTPDVPPVEYTAKEKETINAIRELGKYKNIAYREKAKLLADPKAMVNINKEILKLDDDVVQNLLGISKSELLDSYKNVVPDLKKTQVDITSNPIPVSDLSIVDNQNIIQPGASQEMHPLNEKQYNTSYKPSLLQRIEQSYSKNFAPINYENPTNHPQGLIGLAKTDYAYPTLRDASGNFMSDANGNLIYGDELVSEGQTIQKLKEALTKVEAAPKGTNFIGSGSLSTDSYPLTLDSGIMMSKKGLVQTNVQPGITGLNDMGYTNMSPRLVIKDINSKIEQLEKLSGKKLPRAKYNPSKRGTYEMYEVPRIYFTRLKQGGTINKADENSLVKLDQLTNFTNYNKPQPGGWLNKYN